MLYQCFQTLKLYGKEPDSLESALATFQLVLSDFPFSKIKDAFAFYLKHNNEFPSPSDIAQIICRGNRPPLDKSVYVSISRKEAELRTPEEWGYMREYEEFSIRGDG